MNTKSSIRNNSLIFVLVLAGILIFANIISIKVFFRGDLTENKLFTLSRASVNLMKSLDDKLIVKAYFTKNLPGRYATLERQVRDLLEEYAHYSNGNMTIEFLDPAGNEEEEKVAQSLGITKMPNPDIEKDQATVKEGYRGISFSFADKHEAVRAVESPVGLEYDITSILKKFLGKKNTIAFSAGNGEPEIEPKPDQMQMQNPMQQQDQGAFMTVRKNLDVYEYIQYNSKSREDGIPKDTSGLVIAGATKKFTDLELYNIDQFLMQGGSIAVLIDGVTVSSQEAQIPGMPAAISATANDTNLRDLLKHYGVEVGNQLVADAQASNFATRCPPFPIPIPRPYPAWPIVTSFGQEHPVTFGLGALTLPYATEIKLTKEAKESKNVKAQELAFSSGNSWRVAAGGDVDPCTMKAADSLESSIPIAAAMSGTFTSYFKGKDLPKKGEKKVEGFIEQSKSPGRLVVVGSSGLPADDRLQMISRLDRRQVMYDFAFVQNILDWMTNDEDLIAVRMKDVDDPPINKEISDGARAAAKWGNIVGIPLAFLLFGVIRWRIRRSPSSAGGPTIGKDDKPLSTEGKKEA
jgi:gliding-associated putative ABC transporter substrate-binding component GldG